MAVLSEDTVIGALLGTAIGDALGMPIEGLSHQNVRTYYKGIKAYRADENRRDLEAGQWTDDTQMTFALVRAITASPSDPSAWPAVAARAYVALQDEARRWGPTTTEAVQALASGADPKTSGVAASPTVGAAMRAAPLGLWWAARDVAQDDAWPVVRDVLAVTHRHPASLAAGWGQAVAVKVMATSAVDEVDVPDYWAHLHASVTWAEEKLAEEQEAEVDDRVSRRLERLADQLNEFPLDVRDECGGAGARADEAWPFAAAMVARRPRLLENTMLSGINAGGDADTTGAMMGAQLGALHGAAAFPDAWRDGVEDGERLADEARRLVRVL